MKQVRVRPVRYHAGMWVPALSVVAAGGLITTAAEAQPRTARWAHATSGRWLDAFNWDPQVVPRNGVPASATYDVVIDSTGSAYQVDYAGLFGFSLNSFTLASPNALVLQNAGTLTINGQMNIQSGVYRFGWEDGLSGPRLSQGVLNIAPSARFEIARSNISTDGPSNKIENMTINGDIHLANVRSRLALLGNVTLNGNISVTGEDAILYMVGQSSLDGNATIDVREHNNRTAHFSFGEQGAPPANIVLGSSTQLRGSNAEFLIRGNVTNRGLISSDTAGKSIDILGSPGIFRNEGTIEVLQGASLNLGVFQDTSTQWVNAGILRIAGGELALGGLIDARTIGTIERSSGLLSVRGRILNQNHTLVMDSSITGPWTFKEGGTVVGGTIQLADRNALAFQTLTNDSARSANFDGVTISGDLLADTPRSRIGIMNSFRVNGTFEATGTFKLIAIGTPTITAGDFFIHDGARISISIGSTLTLGPDAVVRGSGPVGYSFDDNNPTPNTNLNNQGSILADGSGNVLSLVATLGNLNSGSITATNGAIVEFAAVRTNTRLTNNGTIRAESGGSVTFGAPSVLGNVSGHTLNGGVWRVGPGGTIDFQAASATITTNASDVELSGATSQFADLDTLQINTGTFSLKNGRLFHTNQGFQNSGSLIIGINASLDVSTLLSLTPSSMLFIEIAADGSLGHANAISGTLAGMLTIFAEDLQNFRLGDRFEIIESVSLSGNFSNIHLPVLPGGRAFQVERTAQSVEIVVVPSPSSGCLMLGILAMGMRRRRVKREPQEVA